MNQFHSLPCVLRDALFTELCLKSEEGIFILDSDFKYCEVNKSYIELIGFDQNFLIGRLFGIYQSKFIAKPTLKLIKKALYRLPPDQHYQRDLVVMTSYGIEVPLNITIWHVKKNDESYYLGIFRDISTTRSHQKTIQHLQNYDQITNLPNRTFFVKKLTELILDTYQDIVVVRMSIDSYRLMISSFGQNKVDNIVRFFVEQINDMELAGLKCFASFGSEDFALLFELDEAKMVHDHLDRIMQLCEIPFSIDAHTVYIHVSMGIASYPENGNQMDVLISNAEKALQYTKRQGGDDVHWYQNNLIASDLIDLQLEVELRAAFEHEQFFAVYQPKVEINTGHVVGFEALVRWQHPTRGLLAPSHFISAIIRYKLSFDLFFQMAEQVLNLLEKWQTHNFNAHISLNADAAEFEHRSFITGLHDLLTEYPQQQERLQIEITESSLILHHQDVKAQLLALKALGVELAIDDFGTGYASLSYLQEFPFDFIKVDRSFITNIENDKKKQRIFKAIFSLGHALDMQIVAEGIEFEAQKQFLIDTGCKYGQGYLFGRPVDEQQATQILQDQAINTR